MGVACRAQGGTRVAYTGFWWGKLLERDRLGDPCVDGGIKISWILWKCYVVYGLDQVAQDKDRWRALVNVVMNLRVP